MTPSFLSSPAPARRSASVPDLPTSEERSEAAFLTLDGDGFIRDCDAAAEELFKYRRSELVGQQIALLLPELSGSRLLEKGQPNPHLRHRCRIGREFRALAKDGEAFVGKLFLNLLDGSGHARLTLVFCPTALAGEYDRSGQERAH